MILLLGQVSSFGEEHDYDIDIIDKEIDEGQLLDNLTLSEVDDLEELKKDMGDLSLEERKDLGQDEKSFFRREDVTSHENFTGGLEEKKLLEFSKLMDGGSVSKDWSEVTIASKQIKYTIQAGDNLWKISKRIFGSGFYYPKIWSINPYITNPHEIEPGMILVFNTGSSLEMPSVSLGSFGGEGRVGSIAFDFDQFGENIKPKWLDERKKLIEEGNIFYFSTGVTYKDLLETSRSNMQRDYKLYEVPFANKLAKSDSTIYDDVGFDDAFVEFKNHSTGLQLNTFLSTQAIVDIGFIKSFLGISMFAYREAVVYLKIDVERQPRPGDRFSIYQDEGFVSHKSSQREGHRYTIIGHLELISQTNDIWEARIKDVYAPIERGDRLTLYSPRPSKIIKVLSRRNIEAAIIGSYSNKVHLLSLGDIVYIDRGRIDGVEIGNIFELYESLDPGTGKRITRDPLYRSGTFIVVSLSDHFASAMISGVDSEIKLGAIGFTKTIEMASLVEREKKARFQDLDVDLVLDDLGEELLHNADKIKLTDDELKELEIQENNRSVLTDHEETLKELDHFEQDLLAIENSLDEISLDEDQFLEKQNLDLLERKTKDLHGNAFAGLDEIEFELGKKYIDQRLNNQENPYGLTEFDLEEIDALFNTPSIKK